ncbi:MAG TPA: formylglycine-generating enzyme family protein [Candidatus Cloacimonas sp.]|jgi:formylglycine-generating enzyme required for sulfatase activity|nr:formylglycine-generating enzyme family protein [Candidatus Cloacimonas sp.]HOQ78468.1 formylglycine-generating enzyme family protein [Candidatus Cloacimonas sp.]HPK60726.1 formylglycine-generating enzyme family protein [Candidatus Cloacimonas sp.]HQB50562.1 formylglycine-generating enzyme family protein [Candidatus Cloacimonas sp.]
MRLRLVLFLLAMSAVQLAAQTISNIRISQDKELGYYTITFDLSGKADDLYFIQAVPYKNGNELANPRSFYGKSISERCAARENLTIFWNPVIEGVDKYGWQFKIYAFLAPSTLVFVEGGTFMMGSNEGEADENAVHQVTVSSFYLGNCEVTQKEWTEVMGSNPSCWKGDNLPVEQVSWYDAVDYCNKLSEKEGLKPCYSKSRSKIICDWTANGYRLPTEAEWEYAARGGKQSKGYIYSGSNELGSVAWYYENSGGRTHEVGTKKPNELGIFDMSGNVYEWCWDSYAYYPSDSQSNPKGANERSYIIVRGGSFNSGPDGSCQVYSRAKVSYYADCNFIGFRVLRASF